MMRARLPSLVLVAALVLLAVLRLGWISSKLADIKPVAGGAVAPDFTLSLLGGGEFRLGPPGKVTVLDFFATWCGPCREEMPDVDALAASYRDRGVRVVAVDAEPAEAREFVEKLAGQLKLTLPVALAGEGVAEAYHVNSLPHLVVVGKDGAIRRVLVGAHSRREIARLIDEALDAK